MKCKGITARGKECNITISSNDNGNVVEYCRFHKPAIQLPKPDSCCVCTESLELEISPLECGHWIHKECVIKSAKSECPLCRTKLVRLGKKAMKEIQVLRDIRIREQIQEEQRDIIESMESINEILNSELSPHIHEQLNRILEIIIQSEDSNSSIEDELDSNISNNQVLINIAYQMYNSESYSDLIEIINNVFTNSES